MCTITSVCLFLCLHRRRMFYRDLRPDALLKWHRNLYHRSENKIPVGLGILKIETTNSRCMTSITTDLIRSQLHRLLHILNMINSLIKIYTKKRIVIVFNKIVILLVNKPFIVYKTAKGQDLDIKICLKHLGKRFVNPVTLL